MLRNLVIPTGRELAHVFDVVLCLQRQHIAHNFVREAVVDVIAVGERVQVVAVDRRDEVRELGLEARRAENAEFVKLARGERNRLELEFGRVDRLDADAVDALLDDLQHHRLVVGNRE